MQGSPDQNIVHDYLEAVRGAQPLQFDLRTALLSLKTVMKIYQSAESGGHPIVMDNDL